MKRKYWYLIFGVTNSDTEFVTNEFSELFGVQPEARYSSFIGNYYKFQLKSLQNDVVSSIEIRQNLDPQSNELQELDYPQCPTLVHINKILDLTELERKLVGISLIPISLRELEF